MSEKRKTSGHGREGPRFLFCPARPPAPSPTPARARPRVGQELHQPTRVGGAVWGAGNEAERRPRPPVPSDAPPPRLLLSSLKTRTRVSVATVVANVAPPTLSVTMDDGDHGSPGGGAQPVIGGRGLRDASVGRVEKGGCKRSGQQTREAARGARRRVWR